MYLIWNPDVWLIQVSLFIAPYFALISVSLAVMVIYLLWFWQYRLFEHNEPNGIYIEPDIVFWEYNSQTH